MLLILHGLAGRARIRRLQISLLLQVLKSFAPHLRLRGHRRLLLLSPTVVWRDNVALVRCVLRGPQLTLLFRASTRREQLDALRGIRIVLATLPALRSEELRVLGRNDLAQLGCVVRHFNFGHDHHLFLHLP